MDENENNELNEIFENDDILELINDSIPIQSIESDFNNRRIKVVKGQNTLYTKYNNPLNSYYGNKFPTFKLSKQHYELWSGPIVYICWQYINIMKTVRQKISLYVGMSSQGLSRPFGKDHHKKYILQNSNEIEILPCKNIEDCVLLEKQLIKFLSPIHNMKGNNKPMKISEVI